MKQNLSPIVVVGSINMDLVSRVPAIPRAGETIIGHEFQMYPGGKGANQAVGVARLDYPVTMIGMLGSDPFGTELRNHMKREGVDTSHIGEVDSASGLASILVDDAGENCIVVTRGANFHVTPDLLRSKSSVLREAGIVLAQLEVPLETIECLAEMCAAFGVPLILDPAPAQSLPNGVMQGISWLTPNETEAQFYAQGRTSEEDILAALFDQGPRGIVLKKGAQGAVLVGEDKKLHHSVPPLVRAVDTTAAGDAFNAAFAVGLMQGYDPAKSAQFATVAAAISVTRAGAQPSLATRAEVNAAFQPQNT